MLLKGAYCVGEHFVDPHSMHMYSMHREIFDVRRWNINERYNIAIYCL